MKKILTKSEYLKACGLFHLAKEHQRKFVEFETELNKLIGREDGSNVGDAIWEEKDTLDVALKRDGLTVKTK